jgi:hypothetical protein
MTTAEINNYKDTLFEHYKITAQIINKKIESYIYILRLIIIKNNFAQKSDKDLSYFESKKIEIIRNIIVKNINIIAKIRHSFLYFKKCNNIKSFTKQALFLKKILKSIT